MAEKNNNSEIEELLSKLRENFGTQNASSSTAEDASLTTPSVSPIEEEDDSSISETPQPAFDANMDLEEPVSDVPVSTDVEKFSDADKDQLHDNTHEQNEFDVTGESDSAMQKLDAESDTIETETFLSQQSDVVDATPEDSQSFSEDIEEQNDATDVKNAEPRDTTYARTVLPESTKAFDNNQRSAGGHYRDIKLIEDVLAMREDATEMSQSAPESAMPDAEETAAFNQSEESSDVEQTILEHEPADTLLANSEPEIPLVEEEEAEVHTPESVWDTLSPLPFVSPTQEELNTKNADGEAPLVDQGAQLPEEDYETPPVLTKKARRPKKTLADVDFTETTFGDGKIKDKILLEPIESLGGPSSQEQITAWRQELNHCFAWARIKCIAVGILTCLLAFFELAYPVTNRLMSALLLTRVPGAALLIDLQLLLLVCLISYRPLYRGAAALRFGRIIPETLATIAATLTILLDIALYACRTTLPIFAGLVGAILVLSASLADFFRIETVRYSFRAYATEGHRFAAVLSNAREHSLIGRLYGDSNEENLLMQAEPATGVDGFVEESRTRIENRNAGLIALAAATIIALIDLILLLALKRGVDYAYWSAGVVFCAILPISAFCTHRFMFRTLSARIAKERVGVAGEDAVYRYADTRTMTFDDTEPFPAGSVQLNGIKLCGNFPLDKAIYLTACLFDRVGGPLNGVFRVSANEIPLSDDVVLRALHDDGIEAQINREDVFVGTKDFLERLGVKVFRDSEDEHAEEGKNHVLYVAYHSELCAKFYVHYEISAAFESNVEYYAKHGVSSVILTADPLLNEALIDEVSYISDYDVRVVKKDVTAVQEKKNVIRKASLITYGPRKTLRRMPFFFTAYKKLQKAAVATSMVTTAIAGITAPVLMLLLRSQTALVAVLCQVGALLPTLAITWFISRLNPNK